MLSSVWSHKLEKNIIHIVDVPMRINKKKEKSLASVNVCGVFRVQFVLE